MNSLEQLLAFLRRLDATNISYRLDCVRDAIMVIVPAPSKYYEIEFFADGHIESQTFGPANMVKSATIDALAAEVIGDLEG